jgi:hypothetical protein
MPTIRICARDVPRFMHGGLEVATTWIPFPSEPTLRQRETLRDFHGRFIQVHPEDRAALREHGLAFVDPHKPLVEVEAKAETVEPNKTTKPDAGGKTDAKPKQGSK